MSQGMRVGGQRSLKCIPAREQPPGGLKMCAQFVRDGDVLTDLRAVL